MEMKMRKFTEIGVSYFSNRHLKHFITDIKSLKKDGFNSILHTFSEEDMLYSRGNVRDMVKASHDHGFKVWIDPWAVGRVFGGESLSNFLLENPAAWQLMSDNKRFPAACLNNPSFREYMKSWTDAALSMGVDAIMWDEPHFKLKPKGKKTMWACRCAYCREAYELRNLKAMPVFKLDDSVKHFREFSVKKFIADMSSYVKENSGGKVKVSVVLLTSVDDTARSATYESVANIKQVDSLGVAPYWYWTKGRPDIYGMNYKAGFRIKDICMSTGKTPHFWLQGFGYKAGKEDQALQAINAAKDAGIANIWVWGYQGCEMMSSLASDRPAMVWKTIVKGLK
jgi:hypothetical protein